MGTRSDFIKNKNTPAVSQPAVGPEGALRQAQGAPRQDQGALRQDQGADANLAPKKPGSPFDIAALLLRLGEKDYWLGQAHNAIAVLSQNNKALEEEISRLRVELKKWEDTRNAKQDTKR